MKNIHHWSSRDVAFYQARPRRLIRVPGGAFVVHPVYDDVLDDDFALAKEDSDAGAADRGQGPVSRPSVDALT